jgi:hypothetical protein
MRTVYFDSIEDLTGIEKYVDNEDYANLHLQLQEEGICIVGKGTFKGMIFYVGFIHVEKEDKSKYAEVFIAWIYPTSYRVFDIQTEAEEKYKDRLKLFFIGYRVNVVFGMEKAILEIKNKNS